MIYRLPFWLLHLLIPLPSAVSKFPLFLPACRRSSFLTGEGEGRVRCGRSNFLRRRESLVLYKSFNTLSIVLWFYQLRRWNYTLYFFLGVKTSNTHGLGIQISILVNTTRFLIFIHCNAEAKYKVFFFLSGMRSVCTAWVPRGPDSARVSDHPLFAIPHEKNCRLHFFYFTPQHTPIYEWHASPGSRGHFTRNAS